MEEMTVKDFNQYFTEKKKVSTLSGKLEGNSMKIISLRSYRGMSSKPNKMTTDELLQGQ